MAQFEPAAIAAALNRHGVEYVVIGAFAAIAQQSDIPATRDIDFTPRRTEENLERLSRALTELGARVRTEGVPEGLPFSHDARSLAGSVTWNLMCEHGEFDLAFAPSAFDGGYEQLAERARRVDVNGVVVVIADLADVVRSKEAAGRPKDLAVLPALYRRLAERQAASDDDVNPE